MNSEEENKEDFIVYLGVSEQAEKTVGYLECRDPQSLKAAKDYFNLFLNNLNKLDINQSEDIGQLLTSRIAQTVLIRDEFIRVILAIAQFEEDDSFYSEIHTFFEGFIPYFYYRNQGDSNNRIAQDHYKILGYELFLWTVAALLKYRKFEQLNELTQQGYYLSPSYRSRTEQFISFDEFNQSFDAVERAYSPSSSWERNSKPYFTKARISESTLTYDDLAQADFFLHLLSLLDVRSNKTHFYNIWGHQLIADTRTFELFVRSESTRFFNKFRRCLRDLSKNDISDFLEEYKVKATNNSGAFQVEALKLVMGFDKLATRP